MFTTSTILATPILFSALTLSLPFSVPFPFAFPFAFPVSLSLAFPLPVSLCSLPVPFGSVLSLPLVSVGTFPLVSLCSLPFASFSVVWDMARDDHKFTQVLSKHVQVLWLSSLCLGRLRLLHHVGIALVPLVSVFPMVTVVAVVPRMMLWGSRRLVSLCLMMISALWRGRQGALGWGRLLAQHAHWEGWSGWGTWVRDLLLVLLASIALVFLDLLEVTSERVSSRCLNNGRGFASLSSFLLFII